MESLEEKKRKKAEYDRLYRARNKEILRLKKQAYYITEAGRATQKRNRDKKCQKTHNEYCKLPEQRHKERLRRYKRLGLNKLKICLDCNNEKPLIDFPKGGIFEDKHYYLCKECEKKSTELTGQTTKSVIQCIVTTSYYKLTRKDIAKHPYLIESKKYLISLNKFLKS